MGMVRTEGVSRVWYREPWPWILAAGPFIVVIAGFVTYYLAAHSENGLVVDNYYKEGLGINRVIDAERNARTHQYEAKLSVSDTGMVRVALRGTGELPGKLRVSFVHPTHAQQDRTGALEQIGQGLYEGRPVAGADGERLTLSNRWYVRLEDEKGAWRLTGTWNTTQPDGLTLRPAAD